MDAEAKALIERLRDRHHTTLEDGIDELQNTVTQAADLIERQSAEIERLRGALGPFAEEADGWDADQNDGDIFEDHEHAEEMHNFTVGDFRRARAALAGEAGK